MPPKAGGEVGSSKAGAASVMAGVTSAKRSAAKRGATKRGAAKHGAAEPASDAMPAGGAAPEVDGGEAADADALRPESPELLSGREAAAEGDLAAAGKAQTRGAAEEPTAAADGTHGEVAGAAASKSEGLSAAEPSEALPAATTVLAALDDEDEAGGCNIVWCTMDCGVLPATDHQVPLIMKLVGAAVYGLHYVPAQKTKLMHDGRVRLMHAVTSQKDHEGDAWCQMSVTWGRGPASLHTDERCLTGSDNACWPVHLCR